MNIIDSNWQEHLPGGCKFVTIEPFFLIWFLFYTRIIEREWEKFWSLSSWRWALVHDFSTLPFQAEGTETHLQKTNRTCFFLPSYIYNNQLDTSIQVEFAHPLQTRPFVFFGGRLFFSPGKVFHRRGGSKGPSSWALTRFRSAVAGWRCGHFTDPTHRIHGTGIFTYMKTIKINQM